MAMDDPWDSPWADETQNEIPLPFPKNDEELRPKTPVEAPSVLAPKGHEIWGTQDDRFGEWESLPVGQSVVDGKVENGTLDGQRETGHYGNEKDALEGSLNGHRVPWTDSAEVRDHYSSSLAATQPKILRQSSLDPWNTEPSAHDAMHREHITEGQGGGVMFPQDGAMVLNLQEDTATATFPERKVVEQGPHNDDVDKRETGIMDGLADSTSGEMTETSEVLDVPAGDQKGKSPEADHESSRPSSSPSDHDEGLPESPRTSFDEDPKRPTLPRKVSSKIQELVQHFDDLSKPDSDQRVDCNEVRTPVEDGNSPITNSRAEDDFEDDFGDFEDGQVEAEDLTVNQVEPCEIPMKSKAPNQPMPNTISLSTSQITGSRNMKEFGRVHYESHASTLDGLYPSTEQEVHFLEKVFVPDVIPHDSFSTVEERKTWYRISRYGTMRKHSGGNDEDYIRVNWTESRIRIDTLDIVARWMEEDRISGRVVLGGGSKGSSLFGWNDPNSAAVPLATAFAKQGKKTIPPNTAADSQPNVPREWPKGLVRTRSVSKSRMPPKPRMRTPSRSKTNADEQKSATLPVASFGWNMNSQADPSPQIPISLRPSSCNSTQEPPRQSSTTELGVLSPILSPPMSSHSKITLDSSGVDSSVLPKTKSGPFFSSKDSELLNQDDGDWGEIMSSPIHATPLSVPQINNLKHKKSQSLTGQYTPSSQPFPGTALQISSTGPGHRRTESLDKISLLNSSLLADSMSLELFAPISNQSPNHVAPAPPPTTAAVPITASDPWASADFSFFDSAPASVPTIKSSPVPVSVPNIGTIARLPTSKISKAGKTKHELEQDKIVASIVKNLPDLCYMLRK